MSGNVVVGAKECIRHINNNEVEFVYIAKDADKEIVSLVESLCKEKKVDIKYIATMKDLGNMCNIKVKAASAAKLKGGE